MRTKNDADLVESFGTYRKRLVGEILLKLEMKVIAQVKLTNW